MNKDEKNIESSREVTIIGYGESGYELVNSINNLGFKITIMDINPGVFSKLPDVNF